MAASLPWGGLFLASFLCLFTFQIHASTFEPQSIANEQTWKSLLHFHNETFILRDKAFLLGSAKHQSPAAILAATFELLTKNDRAKCRFPARYLWLSQKGLLPQADLATACPEFGEFLRKVPADQVSLIFASEHLSTPSSMMGHSMLSFKGINDKNIKVEHAVSFSVKLPSNPFSLVKDVVLVGKTGQLMVEPIQTPLNRYLQLEQRNVWTYPLDLNAAQIALIQAHIWELKFVNIPYRFQSHNCATLLVDVISLAFSGDNFQRATLISPTDLVKTVHHQGLIQRKELMPSSLWKIRMMTEFTTPLDEQTVVDWLAHPTTAVQLTNIQQLLAKYLLAYRFEKGVISPQDYQSISAQMVNWDNQQVTLKNYREPLKSYPDSHIRLGWQDTKDGQWLIAGYLPAAHDLFDDNRNFFSESALRLSDIQVRLSTEDYSLQLDEWMLYEVTALNPYSSLTGGLSGSFSLGFDRREYDSLYQHLGLSVHGGVGHTRKLAKDVGIFLQLGAGSHIMWKHNPVFASLDTGLWIYQIGNMKSWLHYSVEVPTKGNAIFRTSLDHSIALGKSARFMLSAEHVKIRNQSSWNLNSSVRFYF